MKNSYDSRMLSNSDLPLSVSPHCSFRVQPTNPAKIVPETCRDLSQEKHSSQQQGNLLARPIFDLNTNPYLHESKVDDMDDAVTTMDAKLIQAQSQFGVVGAAAVAIAAHRQPSGAF